MPGASSHVQATLHLHAQRKQQLQLLQACKLLQHRHCMLQNFCISETN